jgi:hypothetical protein
MLEDYICNEQTDEATTFESVIVPSLKKSRKGFREKIDVQISIHLRFDHFRIISWVFNPTNGRRTDHSIAHIPRSTQEELTQVSPLIS